MRTSFYFGALAAGDIAGDGDGDVLVAHAYLANSHLNGMTEPSLHRMNVTSVGGVFDYEAVKR